MPGARKPGRRVSVLDIVFMVGIACSLGVLGYLFAADLYARYLAEQCISRMEQLYTDENDDERLECKAQAVAYNDHLAGIGAGDEIMEYHDQLIYRYEPMMSYIEIPKIAVKQPVYHGTDEAALMAGVGHLEGSSLPVGGETSHCVLLGHSGMRNARMFDDLRQLEAGDKFVIWTLNEPYAYEVFRKEVVLPDEAERKMGLVQGQDLVTLVTCTPYGVNSHRLLVQARRCAYDAGEMGDVGLSAYVNGRTMPLAVPLAALVVLGVASVVARGAGKRRKARKSAGERMVNGTSCEADDFGVKNE